MYLKRLEMSGFKSFADRTELVFVPGVTAVVGPNGSGKSNVTDGIRWVLGEQSAKSLRGNKMEDVIFAGSDSRKPVGICEVSLVLDNSERRLKLDFAEVRITRRVSRSGESEYFLNQKPCRLKDITELFMDTGIGKEAYSMIGQGRIDDILSTKSEDRRAIFEEAAGIVKYKVRKKEAEKKLEQTEQNLTRIYDLIYELESQVAPLEEQAEKATRFKELKQELEQVEVGLYVYKIETLHQHWLEISQEVKELSQRQMALSTLISKREAELEEYKCLQMDHDAQLEQVQAELLKVSEDLEKTEGLREVQLERNRSRQQAQGQLQERMKLFRQDLARLQEEKKQLTERLSEKQAKLREVEASIQTIQEQLHLLVGDEQKQLDHSIAKLQRLKNAQVVLQNEQHYTIQGMEQAIEQIEQFTSEKKRLQEGIAEEKEQQIRVKQRLAETTQTVDQLTAQLVYLRERQQQNEELESQLRKQQKKGEQIYHRLCSRRDVLQEMEKKHTGFFQGVKSILTARDQGIASLQQVHGAVAQLLVVPEKYEAALETALGGALQYLVVEDEQTARQGIAYLKEKGLGRATFLPLDVIKERKISPHEIQQLQKMAGWLGVAADLVETSPRYSSLVSYLLGMVIVAETLEQANQIARKLQYRYRVVTLDGDLVNIGGSMTGGSRQPSKSNLLGRSRQLESLEQQVVEQKEQLEQLNDRVRKVEEQKKKTQHELEEIRQQIEKSRLREQALQSEQREREKQIQQMEQSAVQLSTAQQEAHRRLVELERQKEEQVKRNDQLEQEIHQLAQQVAISKEQIKERETIKEQTQQQLTRQKVMEAELRQEVSNLQENLERIEQERRRLAQQLATAEQEQYDLMEQQNQSEEILEQLVKQIEQLRKDKLAIQEKVAKARAIREQMVQQRNEKEEEIRKERATLQKEAERLKDCEVKANRMDVELNYLLQKLAEEYEITFERAKEEHSHPEDPKKAERRVRSLKREIASLGEIHLGAIEEFQRLRERLSFLKEQEVDLTQAKQSLFEVIKRMEEEMGKRFYEAFSLIRQEFQTVFVQMFGGGRADLHLSDPDNLLETGIEIVAQPPGKKLQNLTLLSGGERALAAIALLFAVLQIKPVPFCVLDEVDAALDEANLTRFTRYLRQFANQTQFIVITHRKHTMEGADVLYGITMQESGVSKLVSVRLEEYDRYSEVASTEEGDIP